MCISPFFFFYCFFLPPPSPSTSPLQRQRIIDVLNRLPVTVVERFSQDLSSSVHEKRSRRVPVTVVEWFSHDLSSSVHEKRSRRFQKRGCKLSNEIFLWKGETSCASWQKKKKKEHTPFLVFPSGFIFIYISK